MWVKFVVLIVLFNLSAFFSGSETAFFSLEERLLKKRGVLRRLLSNKERLLTTILLGNEVVNVAASSIAASLFMDAFGERWVGLSVFVTTFFLLIYGELLPKSIAVKYNRIWATLAAYPLAFISIVLFPARMILEGVSSFVSALVGREERVIREDDFKVLVSEAESRGVLEEKEKEMIFQVFRFTELQVKDIMVPEPDIFMVDVNIHIERLRELLKTNKFSKIPVYEGTRDNVLGYVKVTDIVSIFKGMKKASLRDILRQCYFVPETKSIQELLREFQLKKIEMAIVVNEYGSVEGLVTLEDILEELVGEIRDEYDREEPLIVEDGSGYIVDAKCPIHELCELLDIKLPEGAYVDTAGGLVLHLFGRVPSLGESVSYMGWRFTVVEAVKRRIKKLRIERDEVSRDQG